ncbi:uroporphyrinogen-III synthase [Halococcus saccharolyticus]|uniref:Uroporphyrinogen-III synthase n=1 Tax=Halococcus saccharolyticus DSM 5350 TaxID=1227455 RepID=M0MCY4_9EURY|nr:uroporphyrinogen-III synthase [Halococcus saccharolyticus]EMA42494.1 uroporphyrinogen-III synthase [Halococcus saccharolyticus DSM 5350]
MKVAVFRPADERIERASELLASLGVEPVADPMLAVESTGTTPRTDAEYTILTSKTGVEIVADAGWEPEGKVCAIGTATADALRMAGYRVDHVPEEFSSTGLVAHLADEVPGMRVEVARSDHGSAVLTDGLAENGAYVHETILYELVRPQQAGHSAELAADGDLAAALFTSSLTIEHFLEAAADRGLREAAVAGLEDGVVGAIGEPTRATAAAAGIGVDIVPTEATFDALARAGVDLLDGTAANGPET